MPCSLSVRSDRRLLRRLLQNLVSNAVKYTPKGRVLIGCRRVRGKLRIDVYDTGLGIPQSKKRVIFREFQRLDEGAKVARGLGLGLSIVERIARVLAHRIDVRSAAGRGSRFSVEVPLSSAAPASQPQQRRGQRRPQPAARHHRAVHRQRAENPRRHGGAARRLGLPRAQGAGPGDRDRGDRGIARSSPNGLLVDYHLDKGNGIDAIAELRRRFGADLPAILITADRSPHVRDAARAHDIQVLNKPIKPAALRALMAQWRVQRVAAAE